MAGLRFKGPDACLPSPIVHELPLCRSGGEDEHKRQRVFEGGAVNLADGLLLGDPARAAAFAEGVEPKELTTFELGAKPRFLDDRMQLNVALFRNDFTDQQLFIVRDSLTFLYNAAESTTNGVELGWQWVPVTGLTVTAGSGLLDASHDKLLTDIGDFARNETLQTPECNGTLGLRKEWPLSAGSIALTHSATHVSRQYFDLPNVLSAGPRSTADARLD